MAAINFPTATSNGQTFTADTGVIYTYIGTPPNGFWSGTFGTTGLATLDGRFVALNDGNSIQTMLTQGLKFNNGSADTILLDGVNGKVGVGTTSPASGIHLSGPATVNSRFTLTQTTAGLSGTLQQGSTGFAVSALGSQSLLLETNGVNRLKIDSSGHVAIGSTTTTTHFSVVDGSVGLELDPNLGFSSRANTGTLRAYDRAGSAYRALGLTGAEILFGISDSEKMRIDSSGRLLVGLSTTADNNAQLQVSSTNFGVTQIFRTGSAGASLHIASTTGSLASPSALAQDDHAGYVSFRAYDGAAWRTGANIGAAADGQTWTSGDCPGRLVFSTTADGASSPTERMRIDSSGRVGVGVSTMAGGSSSVSILRNNEVSWADNDGTRRADIYGDSSSNLVFRNGTGSTERLRIDSSGNVGVGESSPDQRLHVKTTSDDVAKLESTSNGNGPNLTFEHTGSSPADNDVIGKITFNGTNDANQQTTFGNIQVISSDVSDGSEDGAFTFNTRAAGSFAERMRIDSSGNVGIGTSSPGHNLEVKGSFPDFAIVDSDTTNDKFRILHNGGATQLQVDPNNVSSGSHLLVTVDGSEAMRIDSSGRLLVGTTTEGHSDADNLTIADSSKAGITIRNTTTTGDGAIFFSDATSGTAEYAGYIEYGHSTNYLRFATASTERLKIDSSGLVNVTGGIQVTENVTPTAGSGIEIFKPTSTSGQIQAFNRGSGAWIDLIIKGNTQQFHTNGSERLRIDSSGRVLIAKSASNFANAGIELRENGEVVVTRSGGDVITTRRLVSEGTHFSLRNISGTTIGTIVTTSSSTAYNTSSDYRLKENVVDLTAAIPRLKTLPVYRFNFIADSEKTVDGFLAHEAQLVVPESVTGSHNEVDGDGNPVMQSIDQAKIVPLLTAALQEAIGRIETLEIEVAALKGS